MARLAEVTMYELRELCSRHWNPIGVPMANATTQQELGFTPLPADEYDTYLRHIQTLVNAGVAWDDVRVYLTQVERDYLMLSYPQGSKDDFIEALLGLLKAKQSVSE